MPPRTLRVNPADQGIIRFGSGRTAAPRSTETRMPPEVAAHLAWLAQRGRARTTIYDRGRLLIRLAGCLPVPLLEATPAMLAQWRAARSHPPPRAAGAVAPAGHVYAWAGAQRGRRAD